MTKYELKQILYNADTRKISWNLCSTQPGMNIYVTIVLISLRNSRHQIVKFRPWKIKRIIIYVRFEFWGNSSRRWVGAGMLCSSSQPSLCMQPGSLISTTHSNSNTIRRDETISQDNGNYHLHNNMATSPGINPRDTGRQDHLILTVARQMHHSLALKNFSKKCKI